MTSSTILWTEAAVGLGLTVLLVALGSWRKQRHFFQGDHLQEIGGGIGYMTILGLLLSNAFSFDGSNLHYGFYSSLLFLTFLLPFLATGWLLDWPSHWARALSDRNRCNVWPGIVSFGCSMGLLGGAAYFGCLNSPAAADAALRGLAVGGLATVVLLLFTALFAERLSTA